MCFMAVLFPVVLCVLSSIISCLEHVYTVCYDHFVTQSDVNIITFLSVSKWPSDSSVYVFVLLLLRGYAVAYSGKSIGVQSHMVST